MRQHFSRECFACATVGIVLLDGCGIPREGITMAGSPAFQPFAEMLAEDYNRMHPDANVTVQGGGSALGIGAAINGAAQIGMADLVDLPPDASVLEAFVAARDGIAVIVNAANPVADLPMAAIRGIYDASIWNWKQLGGPDEPITVVSRESGSGTRSSFESILGGFDLSVDAIIQDSNGTVRETVANDARAIGYISLGLVDGKVKALTVDGAPCSKETIMDGSYRLVRPIFLLTRREGGRAPSAHVRGFIDFVLGDEGQAALEAEGLIPARHPGARE